MESYDLDIRRLICRERVAQLARDGQRARYDGRRPQVRRELHRLFGAAVHRRAGHAQPARR
jgi:hypothetical protein